MKNYYSLISKTFIYLLLNFFILSSSAKSAEQISFVSGIFNRTITIDLLDNLAKTGEAQGSLKNILKFSNQSPKDLANLLNQEFDLPLTITSKLMYSTIGEVIILRVAKIIYPIKIRDKSITVPAIRSGVIGGILIGNGKLSLIQFFKSYPNKTIAINIPALSKIINKVDSMSELIKFFSSSPLEGIKKDTG